MEFMEAPTHSGSYNLSLPCSSTVILRLVPFRLEHSSISYFLHLDKLKVSELIAVNCKKKRLWWELRDALIYGYNNKPWGNGLILYPSSTQNNASRFFLKSYDDLFRQIDKFYHVEQFLNSIRKLLVTHMTGVPLLLQWICFNRLVIIVAHRFTDRWDLWLLLFSIRDHRIFQHYES